MMINFSVIVPVFNTDKFLGACIESVLQQTYPYYELILVDDGSSDSSAEICDHYACMYPEKIVVAHRDNHGAFHARFHGVDLAQGDVLTFLDSDDTWRLDTLEKLAESFEKFQCDMLLFEAEACSNFSSLPISSSLEENVIYSGEKLKTIYTKLIKTRELNSVCLKAVRRKCISIPKQLRKLENINHGEDLLFSTHLITSVSSVVLIKQGLYHYRMRQGSLTHNYTLKSLESIKTVHKELDRYINQWKIPKLYEGFNARKVDGCMVTLLSLLDNKHRVIKTELRENIRYLANDPYFVVAYCNMDCSQLSVFYRVLAWCLYRKWYCILIVLHASKVLLSKLKHCLIG